ncbi:MAG: photosystem reaction center subunit H [Candidatus Micrarchaeota archaeon]|nr:photosystem reaction center subunit H [Candidatus Micrarchaeota archaeon]
MVTVKDMSEMFGKDVFTDRGVYCGKVYDVKIDLSKFRVKSLVIEARGPFLANIVAGKKGVVVPYHMVNSIGDVVIIKHINISAQGPQEEAV